MIDNNPYFGTPWNDSIAALPRAKTPVGELCLHCREAIQEGDTGVLMPYVATDPARQEEFSKLAVPIHRECLLRLVCASSGAFARLVKSVEEHDALHVPCPECGQIGGTHAPDCEDEIDTVVAEEAR
jgi:hypothetical protein